MRLSLVTGTPFTCACIKCGKRGFAGDNVQTYFADLDGKAFVDYYCEECAKPLQDFTENA